MTSETVESGRSYNALWWAKVQSAGPLQVSPDTPAVPGLTRAAEPDGSSVWMLPTLPDGAGHGVLEELGMPPVAVEMPNETARVLAICVTCCWQDRSTSPWPGSVGTLTQVKAVYAGLRGRPEQSSDLTLIIGSLRRLHATNWLIWNEKLGEVRLGPRVTTWTPTAQTTLRELCRILPDPPPALLAAPKQPEVAPDPLPTDADAPNPAPSPDAAPSMDSDPGTPGPDQPDPSASSADHTPASPGPAEPEPSSAMPGSDLPDPEPDPTTSSDAPTTTSSGPAEPEPSSGAPGSDGPETEED
ncbi:hypothetical protein OHA70_37195 [Kribbella sp. NBC_00382]|uniref:hypothetical protein n=1 Tax=Kribbella sp. NBC_00382 TaxID=2975967 RepID=UPI002E1CF32D